jgi:mycothiol synthase
MANAPIQETFKMRPATLDDVDRAVEFVNLCAVAETGAPQENADELRNNWTEPGFDLEESIRLVETPEGQIVGYAEVIDRQPIPTRIWTYCRTHPQFEGQGIGTQLMEWAEARARQAIPRVPEDMRVVLLTDHITGHESARDLLLARGMQYVRTFWQMRIDMQTEPPAPEWPEGIAIRPLVFGENETAMHLARRDSFRDHWGFVEQPLDSDVELWGHHMRNDPNFDPNLFFLAYDGDDVVGVSLCWPESEEDPTLGWVGTLGVVRRWRRKGLALALLQHSFREFWARGKRAVGLGVDAANPTGATHLYEKAGMRRVREWIAYELELRPGKE